MKTMKFNKTQILDALKKNREEHIEIVREAQSGFREKAISIFEQKLVVLRSGGSVEVNVHLDVPASHVDEFDNVIAMLEMTQDDTIELSDSDFQCFVRNKWRWEHQFLASNSCYSAMAAIKLAAE